MNLDIITVKNVSKTFNRSVRANKKVLDAISLSVKSGEILGIIGRNGCGKSTLLNLIAGIMYPDCGEIKVNGTVASI